MDDLTKRLDEEIIADAFADHRITDGRLAERLIRERKEAAARIRELEALVGRYINMVAYVEGTDFLDYEYPQGSFQPITAGTPEFDRYMASIDLTAEETKTLADLAIKARATALLARMGGEHDRS